MPRRVHPRLVRSQGDNPRLPRPGPKKTPFLRLLGLYALTKGALLLLLFAAPHLEPYQGRDRTPLAWRRGPEGPYLYVPARRVDAWVRNDAGHYLQLALLGYEPPMEPPRFKEGFFPGYPALIRGVVEIGRALGAMGGGLEDYVWGALLISQVSILLALLGLVRLGELWIGPRDAWRSAVALMVCPGGFLLSSSLSESLFLALSIHSVLWLERGRPLRAGLLGAAGATVRLFGVVLALPLGLRTLWAPARGSRRRRALQAILMIPCGLLIVLWVMARETGSPWTYFTIQRRLLGHADFPTLSGVRGLFDSSVAAFEPWRPWQSYLNLVALVSALFLMGSQLWLTRRGRLPASWLAYSAVMLALPTLAGSILSLPRYCLVVFPLFLAAGPLLPGGRWGWIAAAAAMVVQGGLFLTVEAHWPWII